MLLGVVADDFTGATDIANTLARGGMATSQFIGIPDRPAPASCDAGVVALKSRSIAANDAVEVSLAALRWLRAQGCRQFVFKYCSTFDSTPNGNIGPVAEAMLDALDAPFAIVCPAFPATGRRVFMGHLFVGDRLLNESGMERHPLNPMTDPDIRRWLARQTLVAVGHVATPSVRMGAASTRTALAHQAANGARLIVVDAIDDDDLRTIGAASVDHRLVTGGSGIAIGLAANFQDMRSGANDVAVPAIDGPGLVLCGSCSKTSQQQVQAYLLDHPGLRIDSEMLASGAMNPDVAMQWIGEHAAHMPIVYSTSEAVKDSGPDEAKRIEFFFAALAVRAIHSGVRRLVVGGGETSGAVVTALGLKRLRIGPEIDAGVPLVVSEEGVPLALALKSGNFGSIEFFAKALQRMKQSGETQGDKDQANFQPF